MLLLCSAPITGGCAADSYAGIPLASGAADPELQDLARRARSGDRAAQLSLADRYERGDGVQTDRGRAATLRASPAATSRTAWVYAPYSPAGQPSLVPLEVADPRRRHSGTSAADEGATSRPASSTSRGQATMRNQHVVEVRTGESPLELPALVELVTRSLAAAGNRDLSSDELFDLVVTSGAIPAPADDPPVPTSVLTTLRDCGPPEDGIQTFVSRLFCRQPDDKFLEIFIIPASTIGSAATPESLGRYARRRNAFTIDRVEPALEQIGYRSEGMVSGQTEFHGFVTPLVHTAFVRGGRAPVIVVGHRPRSPAEGDSAGLPPAVFELRLYFPAKEVS